MLLIIVYFGIVTCNGLYIWPWISEVLGSTFGDDEGVMECQPS